MKENILLLFGGRSSEHDVSLKSATTILKNIDRSRYEVYPVGITKEGEWRLYSGNNPDFTTNKWQDKSVDVVLSPDTKHRGLIVLRESDATVRIRIDKVFPIIHGKNGEDGSLQGLFQLANIPYVGPGVLSSAVAMDKAVTKLLVKETGVPQAAYELVRANQLQEMERTVERIESNIGYPCFVKPANAGSSVGVSKATDRINLEQALKLAIAHDKKILVEETIIGREVEVAVLGNEDPQASCVGEVLAAAEFYDFDAKYNNEESKTVVDPDLDVSVKEQLREYAKEVYCAVEAKGLSRVDFFVKSDNSIVFNEINTLPGFTSISMYPMLWQNSGIDTMELITNLLELASL